MPNLHLWHDVPAGPDAPHAITAVVEIPTNGRNKYELDKQLGVFRLDRVLHAAVHYPGDYGFIPQTLGEDDDPLDILLITTVATFPGCLVDARPVGVFHLIDKGVSDEKILAVPLSDPYANDIRTLDDLPSHKLREIEHFFEVYKDLEGHVVESRGFAGVDQAKALIRTAMERHRAAFGAVAR